MTMKSELVDWDVELENVNGSLAKWDLLESRLKKIRFEQTLIMCANSKKNVDRVIHFLGSFAYLNAKANSEGVDALLGDFNLLDNANVQLSTSYTEEIANALKLIPQSIRKVYAILSEDLRQLPTQLMVILNGLNHGQLDFYINQLREFDEYPWLQTYVPPSTSTPTFSSSRSNTISTSQMGPHRSIAISGDGRYVVLEGNSRDASKDIASNSYRYTEGFTVWDVETGQPVKEVYWINLYPIDEVGLPTTTAIAVSFTGEWLAVAFQLGHGTKKHTTHILTFNAQTGHHQTVSVGERIVLSLSISRDGQLTACECIDGLFILCVNTAPTSLESEGTAVANTRQIVMPLSALGYSNLYESENGYSYWVIWQSSLFIELRHNCGVAFDPFDRFILTATQEQILVWDLRQGQLYAVIPLIPSIRLRCISVSTSNEVVGLFEDGRIYKWSLPIKVGDYQNYSDKGLSYLEEGIANHLLSQKVIINNISLEISRLGSWKEGLPEAITVNSSNTEGIDVNQQGVYRSHDGLLSLVALTEDTVESDNNNISYDRRNPVLPETVAQLWHQAVALSLDGWWIIFSVSSEVYIAWNIINREGYWLYRFEERSQHLEQHTIVAKSLHGDWFIFASPSGVYTVSDRTRGINPPHVEAEWTLRDMSTNGDWLLYQSFSRSLKLVNRSANRTVAMLTRYLGELTPEAYGFSIKDPLTSLIKKSDSSSIQKREEYETTRNFFDKSIVCSNGKYIVVYSFGPQTSWGWSPRSNRLAIWNTINDTVVPWVINDESAPEVSALCGSRSSTRVLVAYDIVNSITLADIESNRSITNIDYAHDATITALSLSDDGAFAVSSSLDRHLKVWNIETGKLLAEYVSVNVCYQNKIAVTSAGIVITAVDANNFVHVFRLSCNNNGVENRLHSHSLKTQRWKVLDENYRGYLFSQKLAINRPKSISPPEIKGLLQQSFWRVLKPEHKSLIGYCENLAIHLAKGDWESANKETEDLIFNIISSILPEHIYSNPNVDIYTLVPFIRKIPTDMIFFISGYWSYFSRGDYGFFHHFTFYGWDRDMHTLSMKIGRWPPAPGERLSERQGYYPYSNYLYFCEPAYEAWMEKLKEVFSYDDIQEIVPKPLVAEGVEECF